jgi:hypothetical protein
MLVDVHARITDEPLQASASCIVESLVCGVLDSFLQQLLAGMRDRGATAAVVECTAAGIAGGSADWVQPNIVVFTDAGDNPVDMQLFESKQVSQGCDQMQLLWTYNHVAAGCGMMDGALENERLINSAITSKIAAHAACSILLSAVDSAF